MPKPKCAVMGHSFDNEQDSKSISSDSNIEDLQELFGKENVYPNSKICKNHFKELTCFRRNKQSPNCRQPTTDDIDLPDAKVFKNLFPAFYNSDFWSNSIFSYTSFLKFRKSQHRVSKFMFILYTLQYFSS